MTTIVALAAALAGNHRKFESFAWHDRPEDDQDWAVVYTQNRDSTILEQSNAAVIARTLDVPEYEPDARAERHGHWACGWVEGYAIRVRSSNGELTPAFRAYAALMARLEEYPILDENDLVDREYEAAIDMISLARGNVSPDAPEDWPLRVYSWLADHNELDGEYPGAGAVQEALTDLGWLDD